MKRVKNAKGKGGKPAIELDEIDIETMKELAFVGCTLDEIADRFKISHDTIERKYNHFLIEGRAKRNAAIRSWQMKSAKEGSVPMLIWLGKTCLGQKDTTAVEIAQNTRNALSKEQQEEVVSFMKKAERFLDGNK